MKINALILASTFTLVGAGLLWYLNQKPQPEKEAVIPHTHVIILDSAQMMENHGTENSNIDSDLEMVDSALRTYRKVYNQNPIGLNDEITAALTGSNQKSIAFIPPHHPSIKHQELTDRHSTPYHFHANSSKNITIRSAGKDKKIFTEDDVLYSSR